MASQQVSGPTSLAINSGSSNVQAQYFASKSPATWSVQVISDGTLSPGDYTVSISSTGYLSVTLAPGVVVAAPGTSFTLAVRASSGNGNGNNDTLSVTVAVPSTVVPCFVSGTRIATKSGEIPVERLVAGDLILTTRGEYVRVRWVGSRLVSKQELDLAPKFMPVMIPRDSFGRGRPNQDLFLSPLHRVQISGWRAQVMFGEYDVLAHAFHLPQSAEILGRATEVQYFHILCDEHEVVFANGLPTETLFPGEIAMSAFEPSVVAKMSECLSRPLSNGLRQIWKTALPCMRRREVELIDCDIALELRRRPLPGRRCKNAA